MERIIVILLIVFLIIIVWQDFMDRKISWILIPVVFISGGIIGFIEIPIKMLLYYVLLNLIVCGILLIGVFGYSFIKVKSVRNPVNRMLGLGDILFIISLTTVFAPINFIVFLISSFLISLIVHSIVSLLFNRRGNIPLAGYLSLFLIVIFLLDVSIFDMRLYYDENLIQFIGRII
jgi:hypothetical protein